MTEISFAVPRWGSARTLLTSFAPVYGAVLIVAPVYAIGPFAEGAMALSPLVSFALLPLAALLIASVLVDTSAKPVLWAGGLSGAKLTLLLAETTAAAAAALHSGLVYLQVTAWLGVAVLAATTAAVLQIACVARPRP